MQIKVLNNLIWRFLEGTGAQAVGFVVSVILARLLMPDDYGTIALVTVIISILNIFVDSGFGNALIQIKDADEVDFSSVFYFNILLCLFIYTVLFFAAPYISLFYSQNDNFTSIIRVLGIIIIISAVKNVQQAYVSRNLLFKRFFFSTLGGTIGAAAVGIFMAVKGYGVWALVCQQIFNTLTDTVILWFTVKWRPRRTVSFSRLKKLFLYGWKLLVSNIVAVVYSNIWQLVIGKVYSRSELAYFNRARQFPNLIITNINSSIDSVLFPAMSKEQEDVAAVKAMTRRAIKISSYLMWPMMAGLGVVAEPLIRLVLTDKWIFCVPYLRVFCFTCAFWTIHTANLNAIKSVGRSDIFLKLELLKTAMGLTVLFLTYKMGALQMARISSVLAIFASIVHAIPNAKLLGYGYFEQLKDMLPNLVITVIMIICTYPLVFLGLHDFVLLALQVLGGIIVYLLCSILFKNDSYDYSKKIFIQYINKLTGKSNI